MGGSSVQGHARGQSRGRHTISYSCADAHEGWGFWAPSSTAAQAQPRSSFLGAAQVRRVDEGRDVHLSRHLLFSPENPHLRQLAKGRSSEPGSGVHRGHGLSLAAVT